MTPPVTRIDAPTFNSSEGTISQQCTLQNKPSKTASASTSGKYQVRKTRLRPKDVKRKMWERTFGSLVARVFSGHIFFNPRSLMSPRRLATVYLRHSDSIHTPTPTEQSLDAQPKQIAFFYICRTKYLKIPSGDDSDHLCCAKLRRLGPNVAECTTPQTQLKLKQ